MEETMDMLMEAIKAAVIKAFFEGFTVQDPGCDYTRQVGGYLGPLIDKIVLNVPMKEVATRIANIIEQEKMPELNEIIEKNFDKLIYQDSELLPLLRKKIEKTIEGILTNNTKFDEYLLGQIQSSKRRISINVSVSIKK
jgi:hypothetical protein